MVNTGRIYILNLALLATHEIDSAYWKEWEMFHLPGGVQFFLCVNFVLLLAALFGLSVVLKGKRSGIWCSLLLASTGLLCFLLHTGFLLAGHPAFRTPVSLIVIGATLGVSLLQGFHVVRALSTARRSAI